MTEVFGLSSVSCASLAWLCPPPGWTAQISCGGKSEGPRPSGPDTTALRDNGGQPESFISDVFGHKTSTGIQLWQRAGSVLPSPQLTLLVVLHSEYVVGWILHPGPVRMHEISKRWLLSLVWFRLKKKKPKENNLLSLQFSARKAFLPLRTKVGGNRMDGLVLGSHVEELWGMGRARKILESLIMTLMF